MDFYGRPDPEDLKKIQTSKQKEGYTYLEYVEMSAEEMKKFSNMKPITSKDISQTNLDDLIVKLQKKMNNFS